MTSLPKTMGKADLRETKQIIHHSKGIDESYPKMYFLLNLSHYVKIIWAFMSNFGIFLDTRSPNMAMSRDSRSKFRKKFIVFLILHLISGKVTKLLVEKFSTSEVISQKAHWGVEITPLPVLLGLNLLVPKIILYLEILFSQSY